MRKWLGFLFILLVGAMWLSAQPPSSFSRFPRFTTVGRPTCDSTRRGHPYFDLTDNGSYVCNGTSYVQMDAAAGLTGSGTANTIAKFSAATVLADSSITDDGVGVTLTTGQLSLGTSSAANNMLFGVPANRIQWEGPTADAAEAFLDMGDGTYAFGGDPAAAATVNFFSITPTVPILGAGQTFNAATSTFANVDHTGGTLNFINIPSITGDANATETALKIGTGWDRAVHVDDGVTQLVFGNAADVTAGWNDGVGRFELNAGGTSIIFTATSGFEWGNAASTHRVFTSILPAAGASGNLFSEISTIAAMDGSDTVNYWHLAPTNADHSGAGNTFNVFNIAAITGDAQATENAINIGAGYDSSIVIASTATPQISFTGAGAVRFNTPVDQSYIFDVNSVAKFQSGSGNLSGAFAGTDIAVVGAAQNISPSSNVVEIKAGAAASVTTIDAPQNSVAAILTLVCVDANVTINDSDAAGAANTIDLVGAATNFVCSQDDTLSVVFIAAPTAGNARWLEVDRSVN